MSFITFIVLYIVLTLLGIGTLLWIYFFDKKKNKKAEEGEVKKASKQKGEKFKNFAKGILVENPLFVMVLGTCPALATTTSIEAAIGMGILFSIVLVCSNVLISLIRKLIPEEIRTPAYIVVIATFVTMVKMLANAFLPELYQTLGVFISLIVVNCIVLGRAEAYASKNTVGDSLLDGLGMGLGYTLALVCMGAIREIIGSGMITFGKIFTFIPLFSIPLLKYTVEINGVMTTIYDYSIKIMQLPAGAFIVFGCIMAFLGFKKNRKEEKQLFYTRLKGKDNFVDDDERVNLSRMGIMIGTATMGLISFFMVFLPALQGQIPWYDIYFGTATLNGAVPCFVGYALVFISAALAVIASIFNKNWNKTYLWSAILSVITAVIGAVLIFNTGYIFHAANPDCIYASGLGIGAILGGTFAILTALLALSGLLVPAIVDSVIVERQKEAK